MRRLAWAIVLACVSVAPAIEGAQGPGGAQATGVPPVLSTVPDAPAGVASEPAQMSGVPLQVGDLPPGIVAVRVIRRSFQENLPGQVVRLRRADGRILSSTTGPDGRAQFDGLGVGERVQVRTGVGGENLESQVFQLPAQGGVRLVLVAGVGAATASTADWSESAGTGIGAAQAPASPGPDGPALGAPSSSSWPVGLWLVGALGVACAIAGLVMHRRRNQSAGLSPEDAGDAGDATRPVIGAVGGPRAEAFEELVGLEKEYGAGRLSESVYVPRREALIEELIDLSEEPEAPLQRRP